MFSTIIWGMVMYGIYCGLLYAFQRQMMFPKDMAVIPGDSPPDIPGLESIWVETAEEKVEGWYIPPSPGSSLPAPLLIFAHGNAELIDYWPDEFSAFTKTGIALLLAEYPGYGRSLGSPGQESIHRSLTALYDKVTERKEIDCSRIVLMGRSLGGGAVCGLASVRPSAALILMSSFISARSFAKDYLVPAFLVRDPFDNLRVVRKYRNPVLIIHGVRDEVIPYSHGKELYAAASKGKMITYQCGHNDCPPNRRIYEEDLKNFFLETGIIQHKSAIPDRKKHRNMLPDL
ncbi:MAG: alpha/beta hydrolase [Desulfococcaceae bacterium]|nr:alpha/beta hydrolase [Desulfococcaceae bacterium]